MWTGHRLEGGVCSKAHPAQDPVCVLQPPYSNVADTNYMVYAVAGTGDEQALKEAVASIGPISVVLDATNLQLYSSGSAVYFGAL